MDQSQNATLETYCLVLADIPDAVLIADRRGSITFANQTAVELFGGVDTELWARNIQQLIPEELRDVHREHLRNYWNNPTARFMAEGDGLQALRRDGTRVPVAVMLNHLNLLDGHYALAICRDMSRQQRQQSELQGALNQATVLATTDPLTGAANRRHFKKELVYEIERSSRHSRIFSLAYFDLDDFKDVNDHHGHEEGDKVLKAVVEIARSRLRKTDLVARIGGDEFAILLPETDTTITDSPVKDLDNNLKQSMRDGGWPVTISCGVVIFRTPPASADDAISAADRLMYQVKASGKNASREAVFERGSSELR